MELSFVFELRAFDEVVAHVLFCLFQYMEKCSDFGHKACLIFRSVLDAFGK